MKITIEINTEEDAREVFDCFMAGYGCMDTEEHPEKNKLLYDVRLQFEEQLGVTY